MKKFHIVFIFSLLFLFFGLSAFASTVSAPEITDINPSLKNFSEPLATGLIDKNSSVLVYLDGQYISDAETVSSKNNDLFYFFITKLPDNGVHKLTFIARNLNGVLSAPTKDFEFYINKNLDIPKILKSKIATNAYFYGESINENYIDLYLDDKLYATTFIKKNAKNTFEFNEEEINQGSHSVYFVARDAVGRKSLANKKINFNITKKVLKPKFPLQHVSKGENKIINNSKISNQGVIEEINEEVVVEGIDNINNLDDEASEEEIQKEENQLDKILKEINKQNPEEIGSLTEDGQRQSDLKWNLIIFLAFLVAVIFWIIWVNKEMREENSIEDTEQDNKEDKKD